MPPYDIHTYRDILKTLKKIEYEDSRLRNQKSLIVCLGGLLGVIMVLLLRYVWHFHELTVIELITSFGATISAGPIFGFIYYSTQADLLSKRKQAFWNSLIKNFAVNKVTPYTNVKLNEKELRKVLIDKINEKLNETLKYDH